MKALHKYLLFVIILASCLKSAKAAANSTDHTKNKIFPSGLKNLVAIAPPTISYSPSANVYTAGTAISTWSPTSSGVSPVGTYNSGAAFGSGYSNPEHLTFDAGGNLYVTNLTSNTIRKFNAAGTFISTIGTGLNQPYGLSIDASGNSYISNLGTNSIIKVTSAGVQSTLITGLNTPAGNVLDASGNIYIANYGANSIVKYNSSGTLLTTITSAGVADVALDASGNIYALSLTGNTITKYSPAGAVISTLTPNVSGLGLNTAFGLTIDPSGNLFISDSGNNRVLEYNSSYTLLANIGIGTGANPRGVGADNAGNIYVTLYSTSAVNKYSPTGGYAINQPLPAGLNFDPATGNITGTPTVASALKNYVVTAFNATGSVNTTISITVNNPPAPTIAYATPQVYTTGTAITTLSPTSSGVSAAGLYGTGNAFGTGSTAPEDITFDASGNIYVTNITGNTVKKYNSSGTFISNVGTGLNQPYGLSIDASGNSFITNYGTNSIIKVTAAGVQSTLITGLNNPFGSSIDASGNIYIANYGGNNVQEYTSAGVLISTIAVTGAVNVALDASGNIYVLSYSGGTVTKYSSTGTLLSTLTPNVAGLGLSGAFGLTIDASGNIYIADSGNNRLLEYNSAYTLQTTIATGAGSTPRGAAIDGAGNIYLTLNTANTVNKYAPVGGYYISQPLPAGLSFDSTTGNISGTPTAASPATNYTVTAYSAFASATTTVNITVNNPPAPVISYATPQVYTAGTAISTLTPTSSNVAPLGTYSTGVNYGSGFSGPQDITFDGSGNLYVTNLTSNTIQEFNSSGTYVGTFGSGFVSPYGMAFDASNNAYIISNNKVLRITSAGVQSIFIPSGFSSPRGIATDASGNVYVANNGSSAIQKYNSSGVLVATIAAPAGLYDVTTDPSGNIYALSNTGGTVTEYSPAGVLISTLTPNVAGLGLSGATGILLDASGNLYITDSGNNRILQYQGTTLVSNIATGTGTSPRSVAVDASGNIYATLNTTNAVGKYAPTGGYFVNQSLPAGLNFDNVTGKISGTPTTASPATNYVVTAYNGVSKGTATVNITVNPTLGVARCGAGSVTITAAPGSPAGGTYKWYASNAAPTALYSSTAATYTTNLVTTTTYYVSYTTGGVESGRTAITATINPIVSPSYNGAYFSYPFSGNANDASGNSNNGVLTAAPALTADRYGAVGSAYSFNGSSQYISTTAAATSPTAFTISLWFNTTAAGGKLIGYGNMQTGASATYDRHLYMTSTGQLSFGLFDTGFDFITTANSYNDGNWHHVIVTVSASGSNLYVDGVSQASKASMVPSVNYSGYWRIGYDAISSAFYSNAPANAYFTGNIDDIAVYSTVFTAAQIASSNDLNQIGISTKSICPGSPVSFSSPTVAGATYTWKDATGAIQTGQNVTFASAVTGNYYLTVTGGTGGCSSTAIVNGLTINPIVASPISGAAFSYSFSGNANDVSGNVNNGTVSGATLTTDRYGATNSAYSFNGSSNYITTTTKINNPTTFTISLWFKTTTASGGKLIGFGNANTGSSSSNDRNLYMSNSGQLYFGLYPNVYQTINTTTSYNDGNWHHAVVTCGPDGSALYVDDLMQAANSAMSVAANINGWWRIDYDNLGSWPAAPSSYYFSGTIDDVSVYSRELSLAEIGATDNLTQIGALTTPVCSGSPITFSAPLITGATYTWKDASGTTVTGVGQNNPTFTNAVAGNYTLTVTGGAGGCTSSATITPVLTPLPATTFTVTPSVDVNANATITLATYVATSTYTWDFNGGTPSTGTGAGPFSVQWSTPGIKTIKLTVTNSSGCFSSGTQTVSVNATTYGNYAFRRLVTLNNAAVGITSNLTNFPVLLSIQNNDLIITGNCTDKVANPNGPNYDFAFVDPSSSTELYYQVENYNQTTGTLLVWVQMPTVYAAANNVISFYYGAVIPVVTHNTAFYQKTWTSDYQAVFHFNEASFTGTTSDGTSNGHVGSLGGFASTDLLPGKIGSAYNFGGNNNLTTTPVNVSVAFTISAWVNLNMLNLDQKIMTTENAGGLSSGGFKLGVYVDNTAESEDGGDVNRGYTPTPPTFATGAWHYVQGVYTGSTLSTYVDGVQYRIQSSTKNVTLMNTLYIGVGEGGQYPFNGVIDEPRVSSVAKTSDWIKMEYVDQNNPVAFTSVSSTFLTNTANAATVPGALTYTWTGATSTDPNVATNWNNTTAGVPNQLPSFGGYATLVIPTGLSKYPALTADAGFYGLTLANGASINLNGHTLSVGCHIYNSSGGQILYGGNAASGITWNGSLPNQYYYGSATLGTGQAGNFTVNNSAAGTVNISSGVLDVYGVLSMVKGNLTIAASPVVVTLKSLATQTASVAAIPSGSAITGNVTVERYLTGGAGYRSYRLLSSPVFNAAVSSVNVYSLNYVQNSMYLTGNAGGGFDKTGNPTLYLFREDITPSNTTFTSGNYLGISAINNSPAYNYYLNGGSTAYNLPAGNGFLCFFRGSRAATSVAAETTTSYVPVTVTLSTTGTLNQGAIAVRNWYTPSSASIAYTTSNAGNAPVRGFNMVGNPYASAIDWSSFSSSSSSAGIYGVNVNPTVYLFDPLTKNFATYSAATGIATGNGGKIISSGQGFFVQANAASPSLTFNESAKSAAQLSAPSLLMGRPDVQAAYNSYLRLNLITDSVNRSDMVIGFNAAAKLSFNGIQDSEFLPGISSHQALAAIAADSVLAAVKFVPFPKSSLVQSVRLNVTARVSGQYTLLRSDFKEIPALYRVWLMDRFLKDSLDIRANTAYVFNIDLADTASFGPDRFLVVIRQDPALAVHLLNFTAAKATGGAQLVWNTENEQNYTDFTVERSSDGGKSFQVLGGFGSAAMGTYSFLDKNPPLTTDLYRLVIQNLDGSISYSKPIPLMYSSQSNNIIVSGISVYPNPAVAVVNLAINPGPEAPAGSSAPAYAITVVNSSGTVIKSAIATQNSWQFPVANLIPGTYFINVVNNLTKSLVGNGKFTKL